MQPFKLYMLLLGCKPAGRNIEQHDIFFGIGRSLKSIVPDIIESWPGAGTIHIDAWREVKKIDEFEVNILLKHEAVQEQQERIFFLNLGGYKPGEFEEYHYKLLVVAKEKAEAIKTAKRTAFYKHTGFKGADSHIDDKYGVDVDDIYNIDDILPEKIKNMYSIQLVSGRGLAEDEWHLGYTVLGKIKDE